LFIFALEAWQTSLPLSLRRLQQVSKLLGINLSGYLEEKKKSQEDKEDCLPQGFEERMEGKGLLSEDGHSKF
jgi:hypothetical protein